MSSPGQIPLSWLLNGGCHCSPLIYCSRGPKNANHPTTHKCSGVQLIFILNLPQKLSPIYTNPSIHPSDLPQKVFQTYTIHPSIHPSIHTSDFPQKLSNLHKSIHPSYLKLTLIHPSIHSPFLYLKLTLSLHPSIHLTYHKNCISNLHYPSILPPIHPYI